MGRWVSSVLCQVVPPSYPQLEFNGEVRSTGTLHVKATLLLRILPHTGQRLRSSAKLRASPGGLNECPPQHAHCVPQRDVPGRTESPAARSVPSCSEAVCPDLQEVQGGPGPVPRGPVSSPRAPPGPGAGPGRGRLRGAAPLLGRAHPRPAPPPPGASQSLCGEQPPPPLARRGRDICIRLAHWPSRFPGCASPAPPSWPHLARRPPAARPRLGSARTAPAPLPARRAGAAPPAAQG